MKLNRSCKHEELCKLLIPLPPDEEFEDWRIGFYFWLFWRMKHILNAISISKNDIYYVFTFFFELILFEHRYPDYLFYKKCYVLSVYQTSFYPYIKTNLTRKILLLLACIIRYFVKLFMFLIFTYMYMH